MNCQEAGNIITDLARGAVLEVDAHDRALAHLKLCAPCVERLSDEKKLTEGLHTWAASTDGQAPALMEERLRAEFRRSNVSRTRRRWGMAAAVGSIAAGLVIFKLLSPAHETKPVARTATPTRPVAEIAPAPVQDVAIVSPPRVVARKRQPRRPPQMAAPAELGTEFLPVAQGDGWTPLDGGRMVRVRLPRSAMGAFGLPVDVERSPDRVQADVMLSDDGLLRAIRFVR